MPFSGNTYINVSGATNAVAGDVVQSAVWDAIHVDYATAMTLLMSQLTTGISLRNALYMNGGLEVWQRGAGSAASIAVIAGTTQYTADRWYLTTGANEASTVSAQPGLANGTFSGSNLCARVQRNNGETGTGSMIFAYPLDTDEIARLRGAHISFTANVRAGATWSPTSGTLNMNIYYGTGAVAKRNTTPYAGEMTALAVSTNLTTAIATMAGTSGAVIPITTTQMEIQFAWTPSGTAGATDYFEIDDVQVEAQLSEVTWTPTEYDILPFEPCLQACQRFYFKSHRYGFAPVNGSGPAGSTQIIAPVANVSVGAMIYFPTRLRVTASITVFNPIDAAGSWHNIQSSVSVTANIDPYTTVNDVCVFIGAVSASAANQTLEIQYTASAGI